MVGDAVHLDQVNAPVCILGQQRVIPGLAGGVVLDAPVGGVPGAGVGGVGGVSGVEGGVGDGQIALDGGARNAADDVDAELEAERMDVVAERLEGGGLGGGLQLVGRSTGLGLGRCLLPAEGKRAGTGT